MEKSFVELGLRILFVRQSSPPPAVFDEAFQRCQEKLIGPKIIDEKECLEQRLDRKVVLVLETFQGPLFRRLKDAPCAILGAPCVLECLRRGEPTPEGPHPVYSLAMQGLRVCVSGFTPDQKEDLAVKIRSMGASFEKNLHREVTHVVVTKTNTDKYDLAAEHKIPVMLESWVHESWEANQTRHKSALEEPLCSLRCGPFQGLLITVSQFQKNKKERIKELVERHGGKYSPALSSQETDALVAATDSGEKYQHAKQWKIPVVNESWVTDSIKAGYSLPFPKYAVKAPKTSTPDRDTTQALMDISCISSIVADPRRTHVNETVMAASFAEPLPPERRDPPATPEKEPDASAMLLKMTLAEVRRAGLFLDGCKVYVSQGGVAGVQEKLRKVLNSSGATRLEDICEGLSHVLLSNAKGLCPAEVAALTKLGRRPAVVPLSWLLSSIEQRHPAEPPATPNPIEPPSPLSKRGMQIFDPPAKVTISPRTAKCDLAVVQQYYGTAPPVPPPEEEEEEDLAQPLEEGARGGVRIELRDLSREEASTARDFVQQIGGQIVYTGADWIVGPVRVKEPPAPNQVNIFWLEGSAEIKGVLPVSYYHRPYLQQTHKPLTGTVIGISNYGGSERTFLSNLASELGAKYQDVFAKKAATARGAVESTHLVCPAPDGPKFEASVKWKKPAVTKDWLLKCAETGTRVSEEPFLLRKFTRPSLAPSPSASVLSSSMTSVNRDESDTITPARTTAKGQFATPFTPITPAPCKEGGSKLSEEEATRIARLSINSYNRELEKLNPEYVSTPETPYGSVVKDDPSPNTRKVWKRYLNSIPDDNKPTHPHKEVPNTEKINKRLRIEDFNEEDEEEECAKKKKKDLTIDSDLDDELLKDYNSQKVTAAATQATPRAAPREKKRGVLEKENSEEAVREKVFMVTGVIERDLEHMALVVEKLGGRMSTLKNFDPQATHLITPLPSRSEKLLAAMAAGLWVVHSQYLLQSAKNGHFLPEENFEWGNPSAATLLQPFLDDNERGRQLATACHRWRREAGTSGGAFSKFVCIIVGAAQKTAAFERMIQAGGGQVVPLEGDLSKVTHCFADMNKATYDLSKVKAANVPIYNPIFLNDYLINEKKDP